MPKVKTHSATKKRFKRVGNGSKIKRGSAYRRHLLTRMSSKRKRQLRGSAYVSSADVSMFKVLLPYS